MLVRCGLMIIRSKEIILEIIKQVEWSGVLFGLVRDSSLVVSKNEYSKTQVKTIHRCWVLFLVEGTPNVSS